jgi:hypothetical protein
MLQGSVSCPHLVLQQEPREELTFGLYLGLPEMHPLLFSVGTNELNLVCRS